MKKKILSATLVATLLASTALMGCTSEEEPSKDDSGNKATVEIKMGIYPNADLVDDVANFEGYIETFNEQYPDIKVTPASYTYATDTFLPLVEAGNCPTIFETWFTEPKKLIAEGLVKDITDVLTKMGWLDKMKASVRDLMADENGRVYGVPRDAYALGIMCNVELFEEAGLVDENGIPKFPKTWEELAETGKKIKEATGAAGLSLQGKDKGAGWHFSNIAWCFGAELCTQDADGKYVSNLDSEEAIAAMEFIYDLKWEYDILTDPLQVDWGAGFAEIGTGVAAMYIGANDAVAQPTQVNGLPVDKLAMFAIPAGPNGDQHSLTGGTPYMFSKDATDAQVEACLNFLTVTGRGPIINDTTKAGMDSGAANNVANGVPVIKSFSCWETPEITAAEAEILEKYNNVDPAMFEQYFTKTAEAGNLKPEEPGLTQDMYQELCDVIQAVVSDESSDVTELMTQADQDYQKLLDEKMNK